MHLSIVRPIIPLGQWVGKGGGIDLVLNKICACRVGNFGWIKSPPNRFQIQKKDRKGFDHLTFPNGGAFEFLVGQISTLPHQLPQGGMVGHAIDRSISWPYFKVHVTNILLSIFTWLKLQLLS